MFDFKREKASIRSVCSPLLVSNLQHILYCRFWTKKDFGVFCFRYVRNWNVREVGMFNF